MRIILFFRPLWMGLQERIPANQPLSTERRSANFYLFGTSTSKNLVVKELGAKNTVFFTGHSIGGAIAILATLASLEKFGKDAPVFAATFGFPLIGDEVLARAVRRQGWANHFFNVVSRGDIFARTLLAPCISVSSPFEALLSYRKQMNDDDTDSPMEPADLIRNYLSTVLEHAHRVVTNTDPANTRTESSPKLSPYKPFGYYFFCSDKGALCVENYEAVLPILLYSLAGYDQASISDHTEYEKVFHVNINIDKLEGLPNLPLSDAPSSAMEIQLEGLGLGIQNNGARLALRAAGDVVEKLIENQNNLKAELVMLEEYMTTLRDYRIKCLSQRNMGYYDAYKENKEKPDFEANFSSSEKQDSQANFSRLQLAAFYDRLEEMVETHQVPDNFQFIEEVIEKATEYRLLVEPLDIANYYRLGKHEDSCHYIRFARPRRYKAIEKWLADIKPEDKKQAILHNQQQITKDSCFWARVEEISWLMSKSRENPEDVRSKCIEFQNHVKHMMDRGELCPEEVLREESSFVKWWKMLSRQDQLGFVLQIPGNFFVKRLLQWIHDQLT